jgi:hypothetical protein
MGRYARPQKKPLSKIAYIDQVAVIEIQNVVPAVTQQQIDDIIEEVNQSIDLSSKVDKITNHSLVANSEIAKIHASGSDNQDLSNLVTKVTGSSLVPDTEIAKIHSSGSDNQDLSGLQPKETGKGLSTNDFTNGLKSNYDNAYSHSQAVHAPSGAQVNADITKAEIEAKLIGEIASHTHAGGGGGLTQQQIEGIL